MPYRPGIIVSGEEFVDETAGLNREMRKKLKQLPILMEYDTDEDLLAHAKQIRDADRATKDHAVERRAYLLFWAKEKYRELQECLIERHPLCQGCGCCAYGDNRFRCLCAEGKRMLSPYRIVWLNSFNREQWRTKIWQVGYGYVPKNRFETRSPLSEELSW